MKIKKRIAFVTPLYTPANLSGSSVVIKDIAEELAKQGYDVSIVTSNAKNGRYWYDPLFGEHVKSPFELINGVKVYRLKCNQYISAFLFIAVRFLSFLVPKHLLWKWTIMYNGPYLIGLKQLVEKEQFNIIHSSPLPLNINKQIVDSMKNMPIKPRYIVTPFFHSEIKDFYNPKLNYIFQRADRIHAVTNIEKSLLHKVFGISPEKIVVIPLFLKKGQLQGSNLLDVSVEKFKQAHGLFDKKVVLFAGNKGYMKGAITVLHAMSELYEKDNSYMFIAIGNNMPEWVTAKRQLSSEFIIDLGFVSQKQKETIFAACDVFCMPSQGESFGLTYLEAWAKKRPVIAADIPTSRELIGKNRAGVLVEFDNKNELKHAIIELCSNKKLAKKMGESGYEAQRKKYDFAQFIKIFKTILG